MTDSFFSKIDEPALVAAIKRAESRSRGEVRIHITESTVDDVVKEGAAVFERLGMTKTAERNGVLIYVASTSRKFAVLGDSGLTVLAGTAVLDDISSAMSAAFREGRFGEGLTHAVESAGEVLAKHFPPAAGAVDTDELSNDISRG